MLYNVGMKKSILLLALFLVLPAVLFSQSNYRGQRVAESSEEGQILSAKAKAVDGGVQIDVFFSVPINPTSFSGKNVLINSKPLASSVKPVFNREGTQVRFVVNSALPIELKIDGLVSGGGSAIPAKKITLNK